MNHIDHLHTAGMLMGLLPSYPPAPDSPNYKAEMEAYERSYALLCDVNDFRRKHGVPPGEELLEGMAAIREMKRECGTKAWWRMARPTRPLTEANILSVLPASPADILWMLGHPYSAREQLFAVLTPLEEQRKITGRSRPADDPVFHVRSPK